MSVDLINITSSPLPMNVRNKSITAMQIVTIEKHAPLIKLYPGDACTAIEKYLHFRDVLSVEKLYIVNNGPLWYTPQDSPRWSTWSEFSIGCVLS